MTYSEKLRTLLGETVQIVTATDVVTGVVKRVTNDLVTLNTEGAAGYSGGQDVTYQLERIIYVRT